jgi:outer membrane protein, multidrug efflux system
MGVNGFRIIMNSRCQLFISEIDLTRTTRDQLTSVVQLYKALGGGWTPEAGPTPGR